jgi:hypothetical protein
VVVPNNYRVDGAGRFPYGPSPVAAFEFAGDSFAARRLDFGPGISSTENRYRLRNSKTSNRDRCGVAQDRHYDTLFTVVGHSQFSGHRRATQALDAALASATAGRQRLCRDEWRLGRGRRNQEQVDRRATRSIHPFGRAVPLV